MKERVLIMLKNFDIGSFQIKLIDWFEEEKRDLPWRRTKDPYKIWVSEIMLQQTRVDTVIPYYNNFMEKFPTPHALAEANEQEVLKAWEGLGYYSRVRNLQTAVKEVQEKYNGIVPANKETFSQLKGVGSYTTGAVLSIAYGIPVPAVDGNVMRVFSRIFNIEDDIAKAKTKKLFEEITEQLISKENPSSFNQGLMELGALVCKPGTPSCLLCPVREFCIGYREGTAAQLPVKSKKTKVKTENYTAAVLLDDEGRVLLRKRPKEGLLADFWEFPNEVPPEKPVKNILTAFEEALYEKHQVQINLERPLTVIKHEFSHLKWTIQVFNGKVQGKIIENEHFKAIAIDEIDQYPLPVPHQKIWKSFLEQTLENHEI